MFHPLKQYDCDGQWMNPKDHYRDYVEDRYDPSVMAEHPLIEMFWDFVTSPTCLIFSCVVAVIFTFMILSRLT